MKRLTFRVIAVRHCDIATHLFYTRDRRANYSSCDDGLKSFILIIIY